MSEFQVYTIEKKTQALQQRLQELTKTRQKIKQNSKLLEVKSVERVNRVALFEVKIKHTSEYLLKLGADYYAKTKVEDTVSLLTERMKAIEGEISKWNDLKANLKEKKQRQKKVMNSGFNFNRNGLESHVESIGQNQEGQKMFNIVEFGQPEALMRQSYNQKTQQSQPITISNTEQIRSQVPKQEQYKNVQPEITPIQEPPKKISKFKQDRMKMKGGS